jgi:hypothetical protein
VHLLRGFDGGQCLPSRLVVVQVFQSAEEQEMRYISTALVAATLLATTSVYAQQNSSQAPQSRTTTGNSTATADQDQVSRRLVRQIQARLKQQGYLDKAPDGVWVGCRPAKQCEPRRLAVDRRTSDAHETVSRAHHAGKEFEEVAPERLTQQTEEGPIYRGRGRSIQKEERSSPHCVVTASVSGSHNYGCAICS